VTEASLKGRAIVVVDPQPDFFEGGALPVAGATRTAERIAQYLLARSDEYSMKIVTQDWHLDPGEHWSSDPNFVTTWPVHCAADTSGARIHASLAEQSWTSSFARVSTKGPTRLRRSEPERFDVGRRTRSSVHRQRDSGRLRDGSLREGHGPRRAQTRIRRHRVARPLRRCCTRDDRCGDL